MNSDEPSPRSQGSSQPSPDDLVSPPGDTAPPEDIKEPAESTVVPPPVTDPTEPTMELPQEVLEPTLSCLRKSRSRRCLLSFADDRRPDTGYRRS